MVGGRLVAIDESQPQGESQQEPQPAEQTKQAQEGEQAEEIEPAPKPQLHRSGCTCALVTSRPET